MTELGQVTCGNRLPENQLHISSLFFTPYSQRLLRISLRFLCVKKNKTIELNKYFTLLSNSKQKHKPPNSRNLELCES